MNSTQQKPSLAPANSGKLPWLGTAFLGLAASSNSVNAAVVFTPVTSGGTISAGSSLYFDLGEAGGPGAWSTSSFDGADFFLNFNSGFGPDPNKPRITTSGVGGTRFGAMQNGYVQRFSDGDTIDTSRAWFYGTLSMNRNSAQASPWPAGTRGYAGFRLDTGTESQFAWADIEYTSGQQLTLHGFAFETTPGVAIAAGAVPELKETAIVMALLAGSAGIYRRQRARRGPSQLAE